MPETVYIRVQLPVDAKLVVSKGACFSVLLYGPTLTNIYARMFSVISLAVIEYLEHIRDGLTAKTLET